MSGNNDTNETAADFPYCLSDECYSKYFILSDLVYYYVAPMCIAVSFSGRLILLYAIIKQIKHHSAYAYQTLVTGSEALANVFAFVYVLFFAWLWYKPGFRSCYWCVWFTARFSLLGVTAFNEATSLISIAITIDRLLAMKRPVEYKAFDHKRAQVIVTIGSVAAGFSLNIFDCFRFDIVKDGRFDYGIVINEQFVGSALAVVLLNIRNGLCLLSLILLTLFSIMLIQTYRNFQKSHGVVLAKMDDVRKQRTDRVLFRLTVAQCLSSVVNSTALVTFYTLQYTSLIDCACYMDFAAAAYDCLSFVVEVVSFVSCAIINDQTRKMIRNSVQPLVGPVTKIVSIHRSSNNDVSARL